MNEYIVNKETGFEEIKDVSSMPLQELSQLCSNQCAYWLKLKHKTKEEKLLKKQKSAYWFKRLFDTNLEIQKEKYLNRGK